MVSPIHQDDKGVGVGVGVGGQAWTSACGYNFLLTMRLGACGCGSQTRVSDEQLSAAAA